MAVSVLVERFDVSPSTVRRDLRALEDLQLVTVVHGGALPADNTDLEIPFPKRLTSATDEKIRIGTRAAEFVQDSEAIILDAGTTTHEVARALRERTDLTVVTNALNIANELANCPRITTIVAGGVVRGRSNCLVGPLTERVISEWHVQTAFISTAGIDLEVGLTNPNPFEVPVKQAMIRAARRVIVVATSDKIGQRSLVLFAPLSAVHAIVTDRNIPQEIEAKLRGLAIEVIIAEP